MFGKSQSGKLKFQGPLYILFRFILSVGKPCVLMQIVVQHDGKTKEIGKSAR
jgi:hypothetical protein